jgi:hypothetical protein
MIGRLALLPLAIAAAVAVPAMAAPAGPSAEHCVHPAVVLWGDGRHDDTTALQAWLRGKDALWGDSGAPVGATIARHDFRLSAAIYVEAGTGRTLENFRLAWPARGETVTGGTLRSFRDPSRAPTVTGVHIVGGDAGEGKPLDLPEAPPKKPNADASCGVS